MNAIQRAAVRLAFGGRSVTERGIAARVIEHSLLRGGCSRRESVRLTSHVVAALAEHGFFKEETA